jgi:hypothetical protein
MHRKFYQPNQFRCHSVLQVADETVQRNLEFSITLRQFDLILCELMLKFSEQNYTCDTAGFSTV